MFTCAARIMTGWRDAKGLGLSDYVMLRTQERTVPTDVGFS